MDKTVAILARTNRQLRLPEEILSRENMKYHLLSGSGFWATQEVKAVLSYLQCCLYPADYALAGAIRAPFWPTKYLPKTKLCARLKDLSEDDTTYWHFLTKEPRALVEPKNLGAIQEFVNFVHQLSRYRDLPAPDAVKTILGLLKVGDTYADNDSPDNNPLENLADLLKLANKQRTLKDFLDYCRRATAASKGKKGVALGTCHSSKGLEFDTVYLIGCQDGMMPHAKSDDLQSEANTFFVGCSRAERNLVITFAGAPSQFLKPYQNLVQKMDGEINDNS